MLTATRPASDRRTVLREGAAGLLLVTPGGCDKFMTAREAREQVADGICKLHETGLGGTTLSFVDYNKEFPYFRDNVLPILDATGIRQRG
ncbi:MAG: hypothetical protein P8Y58_17025 [Novosphingobium sp.]